MNKLDKGLRELKNNELLFCTTKFTLPKKSTDIEFDVLFLLQKPT